MRSFEDIAALQLEALSAYLAFTRRDACLPLSAQIARDAAAGDIWAKRVINSRILESPGTAGPAESPDDLVETPLVPIAVGAQPAQARKRVRNAALGLVNGRSAGRRRWPPAATVGSGT